MNNRQMTEFYKIRRNRFCLRIYIIIFFNRLDRFNNYFDIFVIDLKNENVGFYWRDKTGKIY